MSLVTADDRKWREESDARTLAEAATIQSDQNRLKGAARAATRMLTEQQKTTDALAAVAGQAPTKKKVDTKINPYVLPRIPAKKAK